jgi:hypothetical protein
VVVAGAVVVAAGGVDGRATATMTVAPRASFAPLAGFWPSTVPAGFELACCRTAALKPKERSCCTAAARVMPTTFGTATVAAAGRVGVVAVGAVSVTTTVEAVAVVDAFLWSSSRIESQSPTPMPASASRSRSSSHGQSSFSGGKGGLRRRGGPSSTTTPGGGTGSPRGGGVCPPRMIAVSSAPGGTGSRGGTRRRNISHRSLPPRRLYETQPTLRERARRAR